MAASFDFATQFKITTNLCIVENAEAVDDGYGAVIKTSAKSTEC
jgi:hypothetical protein